MVCQELDVYLLAYNLLRTLMWLSGTTHGKPPLRLSLPGTRQQLNNFVPELLANFGAKHHQIDRTLLKIIAHKPVPERPGRIEPRARKRCPKSYSLMQRPKHQFRQQLQTAKSSAFPLNLLPFDR